MKLTPAGRDDIPFGLLAAIGIVVVSVTLALLPGIQSPSAAIADMVADTADVIDGDDPSDLDAGDALVPGSEPAVQPAVHTHAHSHTIRSFSPSSTLAVALRAPPQV